MIKVFNGAALDLSTDTSITVYGIANPTVNNIANSYTVYHYGANGIAKSVGSATGIIILALPTNISIKSLESSVHSAFVSGDYTFDFFLPGLVFDANDNLRVKLPL